MQERRNSKYHREKRNHAADFFLIEDLASVQTTA
jgi:hypothetical protein